MVKNIGILGIHLLYDNIVSLLLLSRQLLSIYSGLRNVTNYKIEPSDIRRVLTPNLLINICFTLKANSIILNINYNYHVM